MVCVDIKPTMRCGHDLTHKTHALLAHNISKSLHGLCPAWPCLLTFSIIATWTVADKTFATLGLGLVMQRKTEVEIALKLDRPHNHA